MSKQTRVSHPIYNLLPTEIVGFDSLAELALDMRWSLPTKCGGSLISNCGKSRTTPGLSCRRSRATRSSAYWSTPFFAKPLMTCCRHAAEAPAWFQQHHPQAPLTCVAYFSMEFMLSEALSIYSGGLGNVAGDQLKAASDLGVPVVGVGLLLPTRLFSPSD